MHSKWKGEQEQRMAQQSALYSKSDEARQLRMQLLDAHSTVRCASASLTGRPAAQSSMLCTHCPG